jgi:hypothetical protein
MTYKEACAKASRMARKRESWYGVVKEDLDTEYGYEIGNDIDLDTFYQGSTVLAYFGPDGQRED